MVARRKRRIKEVTIHKTNQNHPYLFLIRLITNYYRVHLHANYLSVDTCLPASHNCVPPLLHTWLTYFIVVCLFQLFLFTLFYCIYLVHLTSGSFCSPSWLTFFWVICLFAFPLYLSYLCVCTVYLYLSAANFVCACVCRSCILLLLFLIPLFMIILVHYISQGKPLPWEGNMKRENSNDISVIN